MTNAIKNKITLLARVEIMPGQIPGLRVSDPRELARLLITGVFVVSKYGRKAILHHCTLVLNSFFWAPCATVCALIFGYRLELILRLSECPVFSLIGLQGNGRSITPNR
jgi:hypothetical protein